MSATPAAIVPVGSKLSAGGATGLPGPDVAGLPGERGPQGSRGSQGDIDLPAGFIAPYGGRVAPPNWLLCNGALYPVSAYPDLFAAIGYDFGGGGAQFAVPDAKARTLVGEGALDIEPGWAPWLGWKGGGLRHQLTLGQMPHHAHQLNYDHYHLVGVNAHSHSFNQGWHDHGGHVHNIHALAPYNTQVTGGPNPHHIYLFSWLGGAVDQRHAGANWSGGAVHDAGNMGGWTNYVSEQAANWHWRGTGWWGGASTHDNVQPSLATSFIIKV